MIKYLLLSVVLLVVTPAIASQIDINKNKHILIYKMDDGSSKTYPIGVGKQGTNVHGTFTVEAKKLNPSWTPTPNMLHGRKSYTVPPGPKNPLGAAKLYLKGDEPFLGIHGTTDPSSIGKNASHGCIRLKKSDILELYYSVPIGTKVVIN